MYLPGSRSYAVQVGGAAPTRTRWLWRSLWRAWLGRAWLWLRLRRKYCLRRYGRIASSTGSRTRRRSLVFIVEVVEENVQHLGLLHRRRQFQTAGFDLLSKHDGRPVSGVSFVPSTCHGRGSARVWQGWPFVGAPPTSSVVCRSGDCLSGATIRRFISLTGTFSLWSATRHCESIYSTNEINKTRECENACTINRSEQEWGPLLGCCYPHSGRWHPDWSVSTFLHSNISPH